MDTSGSRIEPAASLTLRQALALGALHGPAELLPISSSAHTTAIPWLLGSTYPDVDSELRKALEVALHAGAAGALLVYRRRELLEELAQLDSRRAGVIGLGTLPAGLAGLWLEQHIDRTLGKPGTIAAGLFAGGLAMGLADRRPQTRRAEEASALDGLWLGLAQACALVPGISRNGATLAAARGRQFMRVDAELLSRQLAVPVIIGATVLKAWRLSRDHAHRDAAGTELGLAALASSASTLLSVRLLEGLTRGRPLLPYAIYRAGLAAVILVRLRRDSRAPRRRPARA